VYLGTQTWEVNRYGIIGCVTGTPGGSNLIFPIHLAKAASSDF